MQRPTLSGQFNGVCAYINPLSAAIKIRGESLFLIKYPEAAQIKVIEEIMAKSAATRTLATISDSTKIGLMIK